MDDMTEGLARLYDWHDRAWQYQTMHMTDAKRSAKHALDQARRSLEADRPEVAYEEVVTALGYVVALREHAAARWGLGEAQEKATQTVGTDDDEM